MTPREFMKDAAALAKSISAKADVTVFASTLNYGAGRAPLRASLSLNQKSNPWQTEFSVEAETFAELMVALKAKWTEHDAVTRTRLIRDMALAIIKITAEHGACTDAALRQEFEDADVVRFGHHAVIDANAIADKGPFSITILGKANNRDGES